MAVARARHILVKTEPEAKEIIAELDKGADFATLAKDQSTGPSAAQGGDLGWFSANQMVAPFSEAVIALENGKYTSEPVKTQFGWHVIIREDSRDQTPPSFESVKEQMRPAVQREKIQQYIDGLRKTAKVEVFTPPAENVVEEVDVVEAETPTGEKATIIEEKEEVITEENTQ